MAQEQLKKFVAYEWEKQKDEATTTLNDRIKGEVERFFKEWEGQTGKRLEDAIEAKAESRAKRRGIIFTLIALLGPLGIGAYFWTSLDAVISNKTNVRFEHEWDALHKLHIDPILTTLVKTREDSDAQWKSFTAHLEEAKAYSKALDEAQKTVKKLEEEMRVRSEEVRSLQTQIKNDKSSADSFVKELGKTVDEIRALLHKTPKELSGFLEHMRIEVGTVLTCREEDAKFLLDEAPGKWRRLTDQKQPVEGSEFAKQLGTIPPISEIGTIKLPNPVSGGGVSADPGASVSIIRIN